MEFSTYICHSFDFKLHGHSTNMFSCVLTLLWSFPMHSAQKMKLFWVRSTLICDKQVLLANTSKLIHSPSFSFQNIYYAPAILVGQSGTSFLDVESIGTTWDRWLHPACTNMLNTLMTQTPDIVFGQPFTNLNKLEKWMKSSVFWQ